MRSNNGPTGLGVRYVRSKARHLMTIVERWTSADLDLFPDDPRLRYEIIDGELHVSKAPHWYHQLVADRISRALGNWSDGAALGEVASAPGIILDDDNNLIPDVIWISQARLAQALGPDGKLHALPELVVEILSPGKQNIQRDHESKPLVYARQGVQEYWIVDWVSRTFEIYLLGADALVLAATLHPGDTLISSLLLGFTLPIARVFAGLPTDADLAALE
jgi:Uma2 family endonuclease